MITLDTAIPSPKLGLGTCTLAYTIDNLSSRAIFAYFIVLIIILILRTGWALGSIKDWCIGRAWSAWLDIKVIDFIYRAIQTFFAYFIKIFREIALDAAVTCPEFFRLALTLTRNSVIDSAIGALNTFSQIFIPIHGWDTSSAFITIKVRFIRRTLNTHVRTQIKDHSCRTIFTFLILVVEIFR